MDVSVICSVYNEEESVRAFYEELHSVLESLSVTFEIIFVNDGSRDQSLAILRGIAREDAHVRVVNFARNFGHEAAMIAGIDYSRGNAVICMDSDLQHPPKMIPQMLQCWQDGFDVVNMVRTKRTDDSKIHQFNSRLFYKCMNRLSSVKLAENASDFFLISKPVAEILKTDYRERTRFLRGIVQMVGFKKNTIEYVAADRVGGKSKYSFFKLLKLSFTAVATTSKTPLLVGIYIGLFFVLLSLVLLIYSLIMWILKTPVSGYTTLIVFMSAFAGIQLFVSGLIGLYIGYIFDEVKSRPIYIVENVIENEE
ncbi:MAG: glycosyltransferase family 2 protein [Bacteroidales bacterium]|nr:glycosyltransferase family 2 protein [Bacteroidales bacterium]